MITQRDQLTSIDERFLLYRAPVVVQTETFADDVRTGLGAAQKHLSPKYFYDALGSALFEAITQLPEYYLTRAETEILNLYAGEMLGALEGPVEFVEFGSGSAQKTRILIGEALERQTRVEYHPIDISGTALVASSSGLIAEYQRLHVTAYACDYFEVLASARLRTSKRVLALFLGSNVGNYEPERAEALLSAMSASFKPGDGLLLGTDLKKDTPTLELAYNDPTGVTAAFDKNLLGRMNRELGGHFDLDAFEHVARYDARRGAVDSFLISQRGQNIAIDALDAQFSFRAAESIHTESSYKFARTDLARLAGRSGFRVAKVWTDPAERFAVSLFVIV